MKAQGTKQSERGRIDMRLPIDLIGRLDAVSEALGIDRTQFVEAILLRCITRIAGELNAERGEAISRLLADSSRRS